MFLLIIFKKGKSNWKDTEVSQMYYDIYDIYYDEFLSIIK